MTNTQVRMICGAIGALGGCLLLGLGGIGLAIAAAGDAGGTICRIIFPVAFIILIVSGVVFLKAYVLSRKETGLTK
ncbi:MAG: hypothetical protein NTU94_07030 [Planctomycetota bacterium]|nr:hypothetical protein [Planctomycetota bacterium]